MMKKTYTFALLFAIAVTGAGCDGGVASSSDAVSSTPSGNTNSMPAVSSLATSSEPAVSSTPVVVTSSSGGGFIFDSDPVVTTSPTIEAEAHENQEMFAPFEVQSEGGFTFIVAEGARNNDAADDATGQAHYTITASDTTIALYAMLNLRDEERDSFFIKIEGLSDEWLMENSRTTNGFEELLIGSWNNAVVGQTYTVKLLRRESGAQIDSLRVEGAMFGVTEAPKNFYLLGKELYEDPALGCVTCHGINGDAVGAITPVPLIDCNFCNNIDQLADKIEASMPKADPSVPASAVPSACDAECAAYTAYYIMEQFNAPQPAEPIEPMKARAWLLNASEYKATLTQLLGLPSNYAWMGGYVDVSDAHYYPTNSNEGSVDRTLALYFIEQSEAIVNGLSGAQLDAISPCDVDSAGCLTTFTRDFARRAFRRDVSNADADRYLALADGEVGLDEYRRVMVGILNSPFFLYRTEMGDNENLAEGETTELTGYEIANMISYSLTGNPPSEALMESARNGQLNSPSSLRAIVNEMVAEPEVAQRLHSFIRAWLLVDEGQWAEVERNDGLCSGFDGAKDAIEGEFTQFLSQNATVNNTLADLFTGTLPAPNGALREFYLSNNDPEGVGPARQGIFSSGIFAARHAQFTIPSPTMRGVFMRERVLCGELGGTIPANLPPLQDSGSNPNIVTNRDSFKVHVEAGGDCVSCHELMDPLGFTMEHLDACGRYRSVDNGAPVDVTGEIVATSFDQPVNDLTDLSNVMANQRDVNECFATQAYQFYLGKPKEATPAALVELIADGIGTDGRLRDVIVQLLTHENILIRER